MWPAAILMLSACTPEVVRITPSPSDESAPASPAASVQPFPSGPDLPLVTPIPGVLGSNSGAQVDAIGLAVRRGPGTSFPLVAGYRVDPATSQEVLITEGVRLDAGYYVYIYQGPLVIDGTYWYLVSPERQPGESIEHFWRWDADGDGSNVDHGWVAGRTPDDTYLIPAELPPCTDPGCGTAVPPYAQLYTTGSARTPMFTLGLGVSVLWYAADPAGQGCDMKITVRPNGIVLDSARVAPYGHGDRIWPFDLEENVEGEYWLDIESDCTWSLIAQPIIG